MKKYFGGCATLKEFGFIYDIWVVKFVDYIIQMYGMFSWTSVFLFYVKEIYKFFITYNWVNMWLEEGGTVR